MGAEIRECEARSLPVTLSSGSEEAWADMLARMGLNSIRLRKAVGQTFPDRVPASAPRLADEIERERSNIARELHAGAGQPLAGIRLNLELLSESAGDLPPAGQEALRRLQDLTDQSLDQIRAVSHRLHPPRWQGLLTHQALQRLLESSGLRTKMEIEADLEALPVEPAQAIKIALYRCAQECLSNVARHSGATRLRVALKATGTGAELIFEDNGIGLAGGQDRRGIGLEAIEEHASFLGGFVRMSGGSEGTTVMIRLPLEEE
jgi:two-component system sensor histidine kinase UhpB